MGVFLALGFFLVKVPSTQLGAQSQHNYLLRWHAVAGETSAGSLPAQEMAAHSAKV